MFIPQVRENFGPPAPGSDLAAPPESRDQASPLSNTANQKNAFNSSVARTSHENLVSPQQTEYIVVSRLSISTRTTEDSVW